MPKPNCKIHYNVALTSQAAHTFDITLVVNQPNPKGETLSLPAWIPGSYMIRDFAKNIITLHAHDGHNNSLAVTKLDKQTWQIEPCATPVTIQYQVYAYDLSVRGAYINDEYAFFNGTNMFLAVKGQTHFPHSVNIQQPKLANTGHWQVATTLPSNHPLSHQFGQYWADNYDELIDHPVLIGEFDTIPFNTGGVEFELILAGGHQADTKRIQKDLSKICQHHLDFFEDKSPVSHYQFITLLTDNAFGGLEHISSTALMFSRNDLPSLYQSDKMTEGYQTFLSLCSHEFFHTWHVKRIKPEPLFQANLDVEKYTEQLWIYEGFTSYYDDLSLYRAGIVNQDDYLNVMAKNLTRLVRNQGRFKQSITDSSFDAWTKFYKQDEGAINNIVSYYNKGAILALCLDLLIKQGTNNQLSLDDVMRLLWQQYGKVNIPTPNHAIHILLKNHLNLDLTNFLQLALYTTDELPFVELLAEFGIAAEFTVRDNLNDKGGAENKEPFLFDFGAQCKEMEIGLKVLQVLDNSAIFNAGVQVNDILIALDGWQLSTGQLKHIINNLNENQKVTLSLFRDKKLKNVTFIASPAIADSIKLSVISKHKCDIWLAPSIPIQSI